MITQLQFSLKLLVIVLIVVSALSACASPAAVPPSDTPQQPEVSPSALLPPATVPAQSTAQSPQQTPAVEATPLPFEHRIAVRVVDGKGEFYDRLSAEKFIPRGYNYIHVAPMSSSNQGLWHSTLNPGYYQPKQAEEALQAMQTAGYNVVRIFIDCCRAGNNAGNVKGGISLPYLVNVIDFMNKAKEYGIFILMVLDGTPADGNYNELWGQCCTTFDGENLRYLTAGGIAGKKRFDRDFIQALIKYEAPMDIIFAYDLTNEVHFSIDKPPLSVTSGFITTANNVTYDLSLSEEKQRLMDENLVYWIDQQRAAILKVDPTALVTVSFPAINRGTTTVNPQPAIEASSADFIDLHAYLGWGVTFAQYMQRFGYQQPGEKPVILGEFGADHSAFLTAEGAAQALMVLQVESCAAGISGWLYWTYDAVEQTNLYHGVSGQGEVNTILSPAARPDPCLAGP